MASTQKDTGNPSVKIVVKANIIPSYPSLRSYGGANFEAAEQGFKIVNYVARINAK